VADDDKKWMGPKQKQVLKDKKPSLMAALRQAARSKYRPRKRRWVGYDD
jgi:hypothetical protein